MIDRLKNKALCKEGLSPAKVYRCDLNGKTVYLKSISKQYAHTTFSVKREAEIMQWLAGRLNVPEVIEYGETDEEEYLIMSELTGRHIDTFQEDPAQYTAYLAKAIECLQDVDITGCPFSAGVDMRLKELDHLLQKGLAVTDPAGWQEDTPFASAQELRRWLITHKPEEEPVFTHGDMSANFFVKDGEIWFYDLARMGIADRWLDVAFAVRDLREVCPEQEQRLYELLGVTPDLEKINYFIQLDEMF